MIGFPVCSSGSRTLENCKASVTSQDMCVFYSDLNTTVCHLDEAESSDLSQTVISGDSGGPVYHKNSGGDVEAVGIISGCVPRPFQNDCSQGSPDVLFTPISQIPSRYVVMTTTSTTPPAPASRPVLSPNQWLYHDQKLLSANGQYTLVMQGDGNLVLYGPSGYTWASWTQNNRYASVVMGGDGNLVIYSASGAPIWWTNTQPNAGAWLYMRDDGNLVINASNGTQLWRRP